LIVSQWLILERLQWLRESCYLSPESVESMEKLYLKDTGFYKNGMNLVLW